MSLSYRMEDILFKFGITIMFIVICGVIGIIGYIFTWWMTEHNFEYITVDGTAGHAEKCYISYGGMYCKDKTGATYNVKEFHEVK